MKKFVLIALTCCLPFFIQAQAPALKVYANGQIADEVIETTNGVRISMVLEDGKPRDQGYVYEFGPIQAYRQVGEDRELIKQFLPSQVQNAPVQNLSLSVGRNADLLGHVELELEWLKRYNPDNSVDVIPLNTDCRVIKVYMHE